MEKHQVSRGMSPRPLPQHPIEPFTAFDVDIPDSLVAAGVTEWANANGHGFPKWSPQLRTGMGRSGIIVAIPQDDGDFLSAPMNFQNSTLASRYSGDAFFAVAEACAFPLIL